MRIFLTVIILICSLQSLTNAEVKIDNLFGVKILDPVEKFSKIDNGIYQPNRPGTYYFSDQNITINRSEDFDSFYLRTNDEYKIINITGNKFFYENIDSFRNNCLESKKQMIQDMALFFEKTGEKFVNNYWHNEEYKSIWDESQIFYKDEGVDLLLAIHCSYRGNNDGKILGEMGVSWVTRDYYNKHIKGIWKKIKKFDNKFIKSFVVSSENV
tara:strand:+ start:9225 stop:9863 length:639 start_codon:yes stop_codon:yes gene_type:complete